jgi:hypothetical protein
MPPNGHGPVQLTIWLSYIHGEKNAQSHYMERKTNEIDRHELLLIEQRQTDC